MTRVRWTAQEDELARTLLRQRAKNEIFVQLLGRSKRTAECRMHRLGAPASKIKESGFYVSRISVPEEVIEDRNRRLMAGKSLTGWICGDPPFPAKASPRAIL
jgi:hypothetical protein